MAQTDDLTTDEVKKISQLANLDLPDNTIEEYRSKLTQTVAHAKNLSQLDTSHVQPTLHSTKLMNIAFEDGTKNERSLSKDEVLKNAHNVINGQFAVRRIM